ncbi:MAG: hypothetical protein L6Q84_33510 [Polyangiaceae bacterium]|nr:hypothetical protein [Polyangiaceae bacterium]
MLGLVPGAAPDELALEAVVRVRDRSVESVLEMRVNDRAVVPRDQARRHEPLFETSLPNTRQAEAAQVQLHLATHESAALRRRPHHGAAASLGTAVLIQHGLLPVEPRWLARVPAIATALLHAVNRLSPPEPVVLLRLRDVDVEHEELGVIALRVEHRTTRCDVERDLVVADHLLQQLGISEVPRDSIPEGEHQVLDVLLPGFGDGRVKLGPQRGLLRALLERPRCHDFQADVARVLGRCRFLRVERHAVLLLLVADAADEHRATVLGVPPRRLRFATPVVTDHRRPSSRQERRMPKTSTTALMSSGARVRRWSFVLAAR